MTKNDRFIILGCDGLFERLNHKQIVDFTVKCKKEGKTLKETIESVVKYSYDSFSFDNITSIIIELESPIEEENFKKTNENIQEFQINIDKRKFDFVIEKTKLKSNNNNNLKNEIDISQLNVYEFVWEIEDNVKFNWNSDANFKSVINPCREFLTEEELKLLDSFNLINNYPTYYNEGPGYTFMFPSELYDCGLCKGNDRKLWISKSKNLKDIPQLSESCEYHKVHEPNPFICFDCIEKYYFEENKQEMKLVTEIKIPKNSTINVNEQCICGIDKMQDIQYGFYPAIPISGSKSWFICHQRSTYSQATSQVAVWWNLLPTNSKISTENIKTLENKQKQFINILEKLEVSIKKQRSEFLEEYCRISELSTDELKKLVLNNNYTNFHMKDLFIEVLEKRRISELNNSDFQKYCLSFNKKTPKNGNSGSMDIVIGEYLKKEIKKRNSKQGVFIDTFLVDMSFNIWE